MNVSLMRLGSPRQAPLSLSLSLSRPLSLTLMLIASGCVQPMSSVPGTREPVRVSNGGQPFQMWEGALARKAADAACGGKVRVSIYDRFDRATGEWIYPEGCA